MGMEHKYAKNGKGKTTRDNENGDGYFITCTKIPIGRLRVNAVNYKS